MQDKKGRFIKGNPGKPKGAISEKVQLWNELKGFILSEGSEKFMEELKKLKGEKYTSTFLKALEYFQPKLTRAEISADVTSLEELFKMSPEERRAILLQAKDLSNECR